MHPDSKLASHGKTGGGGGGGQLQLHNVSQSPACGLSAKGLGAGAHGGGGSKASQPAPGGSGLKNSQAPVPTFGALKGKVKREQSVSGDSGERREAGAAAAAAAATSLDKELKGEVAPRSKRRCVLERKQPYSGDEWCSGPDSEEDDKPLGSTHNCNAAESAMTAASQLGPGPNLLPALSESNASSTPHGTAPGLRPDAGSGGGKQPLQFVYVFTTHLANTAAEAVLQGRADSILGYHQQHVPRAKLDQAPVPKLQAAPEPLPVAPSPASTPQSQAAVPPSSQAQGQPPPPALPSQPPAAPPLSLGQGPPPPVNALPQEGAPEDPRRDLTPNSVGNGSSSTAPSGTHPSTPTAPSSLSASTAEGLLGEAAGSGPPSAGNGPRNPLNTEGLSKEQLEHRERSLQTLRDIERLLLRSSEAEPFLKAGEGGALPPAQAPPPPQAAQAPPPPGAGLKKYEEPLQSMISQTQSLGGPGLEQEGPVPPGLDVGQQMNLMMQRLGQDSLTPEQVAWRKLQEEYYEEKRRKEEQVGMHGARPLPDMMLPQPLGGMMLRGPPPPYHSKPGEQWLLRGVPMEPLQEPLQLRPAFSGPRFPGNQLPRGFAGMQNLPLETLGPMSSMQRPGRPGMAWSEDMPLGGPGNFAPGNLPYPPGPGEAERFLTPRAREEILRQQQQLLEKRQAGLQRPLGVEMERVMQAHRQMEPAMFAGEGLGMEFAGSRAMMSPPLREMEPALGPGNLNMNMNVNMNMNMNLNVQMTPQQQQQLLMSQKMRGPELLPAEEMARARAPNGTGAMMSGGPPKMMMGSPFSNQGQQSFPAVQGPYPAVPQEMGSAPDMFGSEQGSLGSTTRLSHIPLPPTTNAPPTSLHQAPARGLGRRPSDLALNMGQMNSPSVGCLKSPTLSQVHSPLGTSPSANLKSPQTPSSALVSLPAPSAPLKSPQVLSSVLSVRSPTSSPGHLKSPGMAVSSPGWVPSPKNALSSPGIGQNKPALGMSNSAPLGSLEQDPPPSQNPLSLMMSQMSKYAMPSSTPLYHNAIKTIATSDDELLPDRPLLPSGAMPGMGGAQPSQMAMNSLGPAPAQSPMGMALPGQQPLSHEPPAPTLSSPGPLGASMPIHSGAPPQNPMLLPPGPQDSLGQPCGPPGQLVFPPRLQQPPANGGGGGMPMAPGGGASGPGGPPHYPPGLGLPPEELPPSQPGQQQQQQQQAPPPPPQQQQQQQRLAGRLPESYPSVASVLSDPELSDVIRPTPTGIPEFDLSRIIPSEKPSSTLQYFPKGEGQQLPKAQPPSNLHLMNLQNMMAEQAPARPGPQGMQRAMAMCHPGQVPVLGRTGLAPQQAMMGNSLHQGMMLPPPPQQQSLLAQQNFLLMQAKQRSLSVSGEGYAQPAHLLASQGSLMGPPGPQQSLMGPHALRQRSVSLDSQMSYGPGPSSMANLPF